MAPEPFGQESLWPQLLLPEIHIKNIYWLAHWQNHEGIKENPFKGNLNQWAGLTQRVADSGGLCNKRVLIWEQEWINEYRKTLNTRHDITIACKTLIGLAGPVLLCDFLWLQEATAEVNWSSSPVLCLPGVWSIQHLCRLSPGALGWAIRIRKKTPPNLQLQKG